MLQTLVSPAPRQLFRTSNGSVEVYRSFAEIEPELWDSCFGAQAKDGRFYQIVQECLSDQFTFLYIVIRNVETGDAAVQPALVVDQDGAAGLSRSARRLVAIVRKAFPNFLRLKLFMVGCAAGEGHLGSIDPWALAALHEALPAVARGAGAPIIVLKDIPAEYRSILGPVFGRDYRRIPGLPAATLNLDYTNFEDYMQRKVGKVFRKNLRRKFRKLQSVAPITMEVIADAAEVLDDLFALYWQVYERSEFQFEILNREFFERLGREMPDKTRFFIWRQEGRIIAFNVCLVHDSVIYDLDLGMDYTVALDLHLYFVTWRDILQWSIDQGLRMYHTGPLNYDPKLHLRLTLSPQDVYARHLAPWLNPAFKFAMQFMHPVRHDRTIRRFKNAGDL